MSRDLVFEIGVEEIPSAPLYGAITQLKELAEAALDDARLGYEEISVNGAPRRLVVQVTGLAERQEDLSLRAKGPAAAAAFDAEGKPTKAAEGFARGKGVDVADLVVEDGDGGRYVYAVVERPGAAASEVLPGLLSGMAAGIEWPKSMRWGSGETRFSRPVRWLLALFGEDVVPVEFAGLSAGRLTFGHRFLAENPVEVASAAGYRDAMERGLVVVDQEARAEIVRAGIDRAAAGAGGEAVVPERTFAEVVNLVEWPTVGAGRFDAEFLRVPREVLETAMESHQRYFPVEAADGSLAAAFVVAHNGDPSLTAEIVAGHERVIRARLADAAFFYDEDLARPLETFVTSLESIVFQEKLGTLGAKVARMEALAKRLAELAGAGAEAATDAARAAHLAKADLVSHVVVEFPSLQGVMGRYYALAAGEDVDVAEAVLEHYQPRFAGDALPATTAGKLVSVADKLDTMCGIFAIGAAPTGSADPYALRRGALGILRIVTEGGLAIQLDEAIGAALDGYEGVVAGMDAPAVGRTVRDFVLGRLEGVMRDAGNAYDTVDAVLAVSGDDPADALARAAALTSFRAKEHDIDDLSVAFTRAKNLCQPDLGTATDRGIMGAEEAALADALADAETRAGEALADRDYVGALGVLAGLRGPIDAFFDAVLVMDEDEALRTNRLRLLNRFVSLFERFADIGKLVV